MQIPAIVRHGLVRREAVVQFDHLRAYGVCTCPMTPAYGKRISTGSRAAQSRASPRANRQNIQAPPPPITRARAQQTCTSLGASPDCANTAPPTPCVTEPPPPRPRANRMKSNQTKLTSVPFFAARRVMSAPMMFSGLSHVASVSVCIDCVPPPPAAAHVPRPTTPPPAPRGPAAPAR